MPAPKGHPRYGGRKTGSPNKRTSELIDLVESSGKDPVQVLIELLEHEDPGIKLSAAKELCQYLYPKRKAIEHTQNGKIIHTITRSDGTTEVISSGEQEE